MSSHDKYLCTQESYAGVTLRSLAAVVLAGLIVILAGPFVLLGWAAHRLRLMMPLLLICLSAHAADINLAWDATTTEGCTYTLYAQAGTNVVAVSCATNLTATLEDIAPGFWSFWATATRDRVESDPSNVLTVEVPVAPQGIRTLVVEHGLTVTNWVEFFRVRLQ